MQILEIRNYQHHNSWLMFVNGVCAFLVLVLARHFVLTRAHIEALRDFLTRNKIPPGVASWSAIVFLAAVFGYVLTNMLRIHDRLHEPLLVKWRAGYDTDLIIRGLCFGMSDLVSRDFFERAYEQRRVRSKAMQRLFYHFVGDDKEPYTGLRRRFYTRSFNYWVYATVEVYALAALTGFSLYRILAAADTFAGAVFITALAYLVSRLAGNRVIDALRPITSEQIYAIVTDQSEDLKGRLEDLVAELYPARTEGIQDEDNV